MIDGILTWHKAINHGAVLQAYATQNFLKQNGYEFKVLDYDRKVKDMRNSLILTVKRMKKVLTGGLKYRSEIQKMDVEKQKKFRQFIEEDMLTGDYYYQEKINHLLIGSDMVFNLKQGYSPYMFGNGISANKISSYAASAGGTNINLVRKMKLEDELKKGLKKFNGIGVRDSETEKLIKELIPKAQIYQNIDPVLLYGFEEELKQWDTGKWSKHKKYILIYAYHGFMESKKEINVIKNYAEKHNLSIVSCGYYHPWCDENINADPKEFLEMFKNATCVVTDTFHGTVFSIITHNNFATIIRDNGFKVEFLLKSCLLESRIATSPAKINDILLEKEDYAKCDKWLCDQRKISREYILNQI